MWLYLIKCVFTCSIFVDSRTKLWKNFLSVFRNWKVYPRGSRELNCENLWDWTFHLRTSRHNWPVNSRLRLATCLTRDWVSKTGQKWIFEIISFKEHNTFQNHLKHSKIFLCLNQQRLSMWKHISSSTITQMNMAFLEHRLVCCVWISTMR